MLAEFVNKIATLAREGRSVDITEVDTLRKVIIRKGDEYEVHPYPAVPRDAGLVGFNDLVTAVQDTNVCPAPEVYHDEGGIRVLVDRDDRSQEIQLAFTYSERYAKLTKLAGDGVVMTLKQACHMLRFQLHGVGADAALRALQKVSFTRKGDGSHTNEHGKESWGKSVEAAVQNIDQVPESILITVPLYLNPGFRDMSTVEVRCGIYVDPQEEKVQIAPMADELCVAKMRAQSNIGDELRLALPDVPVFHGCP